MRLRNIRSRRAGGCSAAGPAGPARAPAGQGPPAWRPNATVAAEFVVDDRRRQPRIFESPADQGDLADAELHQHHPVRRQPAGRTGDHPAQDVGAVRAAVQGDAGFVVPRLGRHQRDGLRRHVRSVDHQHIDDAAQRRRQGVEQITLIHRAAGRLQVPPRAAHRGRVDVGRVQPDPGHRRRDRRPDRAAAAAQIQHYRRLPPDQMRNRFPDKQFAASPGHEDPFVDGDPQTAELDPADDVLQRLALDASAHHGGQLVGVGRRRQQQPRLVLGEHAAGGPQRVDHPARPGRPARINFAGADQLASTWTGVPQVNHFVRAVRPRRS